MQDVGRVCVLLSNQYFGMDWMVQDVGKAYCHGSTKGACGLPQDLTSGTVQGRPDPALCCIRAACTRLQHWCHGLPTQYRMSLHVQQHLVLPSHAYSEMPAMYLACLGIT